MRREIRVDVQRLRELAADLGVAHRTLSASPRYSELDAGDRRGRLADAVSDFINKNITPREELVQQLDIAHQAVQAAHINFGDTESCLVRALRGDD